MTHNMSSNRTRAFCVVQFIELPFEGIDDYVCVPNTWLTVRRATDQKAVVAYPSNEDPFDTRDRAERKERYNDKWTRYMAAVKYVSDSYRDAEFWIATRNDYGPLVEEESKITQTQSRVTSNNESMRSPNQSHPLNTNDDPRKPLPRNKRPALSEPNKQHEGKRLKLSEAAQSSSAVVNYANAEPGCLKMEPSIIIQDNQSMECAQTEETAAASNGESSQRTNENLQESLPMQELQNLNMPKYSHIMNGARKLVPIKKTEKKRLRLMNNTRNLAIAAQNPSNLMDETGSLSTRSLEEQLSVVTQYQSRDPRVLKMHAVNNRDQTTSLRSIAISSQEIQQVPKINVKRYHDMAAVKPRNVLHSANIASATQNISSSSHQRPSIVRRSDEHIRSLAQEQCLTHSHQNQYLSTNQDNFEQDLLMGSTECNNYDHQPTSRTIRMRIPPIRQTSTHPSNPMYQTSELPQQSQPNQHESQRQPQRPKISIGIPFKPKNKRKPPTHQGVTKKTLTPILTKLLNSVRQALNEQQLQTSQRESDLVNESHLNVMDDARQANECMVEEPLSPYHAATWASNAVTNHEVISDHEMSTNEAPVETTNNVYCTRVASGNGFAHRPTAAQNSTSSNLQTHPRVVLEQQMLDNFATLFTQMGSNLRYTCDMYNNLRSSILETAETYKKLLAAVERFNTLTN